MRVVSFCVMRSFKFRAWDKNGKDVYKGDIVSFHGDNYRVGFDDCSFSMMYVDGREQDYFELLQSDYSKQGMNSGVAVVGNVFADPSLLGGVER